MSATFEPRPAPTKLRSGPGGLPRGHVAEIQRGRMLAAALETVAEVGYSRMTVAQVIGRARVSRKTFYDMFEDREDCFLAVFERAVERARGVIEEAYRTQPTWRDGVRAALARLLVMMDEEPALARLCVVEALGAGPRVLAVRAALIDEAAAVVDRGRGDRGSGVEPPELAAEGVVGAVLAVLHARLRSEPSRPLRELLGQLMSLVVLPYLGPRAATRELRRPGAHAAPVSPVSRRSGAGNALEGLDMRLTYRTVRVLAAISAHPGASNREIAERSGVTDQGQISKLLNRLARYELIVNVGDGHERGGSNAWELTTRGAQVERAARPL